MSNKTQYLTVLNLDKLIEDVVGVGGGVFKDMSYEKLEKFLTSNHYVSDPQHDHYFALFKLIYEEPEKAVNLLEKVARHLNGSAHKDSWNGKQFRKAKEGKRSFLRDSRISLRQTFEDNHYPTALSIYSHTILYIWALAKNNPTTFLNLFQGFYKKLAKKNKIKDYWEENQLKVKVIIQCLKTKDFSTNIQPKHLELKVVPKKETLTIQEEFNINNCAKLAKYLIDSEKASFKNLGLIEGKAILIPRKGKADWSNGVYIVTYDSERRTDKFYKTEKPHTDEEIVEKTTGKGEITKPPIDEITRTLIDLA